MIYVWPLEVCHLQMIRAKGLSHFMWLRSSENFIQRGCLEVEQLQQRKSFTLHVLIFSGLLCHSSGSIKTC